MRSEGSDRRRPSRPGAGEAEFRPSTARVRQKRIPLSSQRVAAWVPVLVTAHSSRGPHPLARPPALRPRGPIGKRRPCDPSDSEPLPAARATSTSPSKSVRKGAVSGVGRDGALRVLSRDPCRRAPSPTHRRPSLLAPETAPRAGASRGRRENESGTLDEECLGEERQVRGGRVGGRAPRTLASPYSSSGLQSGASDRL